jgi:hypothetical protein
MSADEEVFSAMGAACQEIEGQQIPYQECPPQ